MRHEQIESGLDVKQRTILLPLVLALCKGANRKRVLDIGCGSGQISRALAYEAEWVDAVDISDVALALALDQHDGSDNLRFHHQPIERFRSSAPATVAVANMSLMAILDLENALQRIFANLAPGGRFVFTIPHPQMWAQHLGYFYEPWFEEDRAVIVDWAYRLSSMEGPGQVVSHVYRPWASYQAMLRSAGFVLEAVHLQAEQQPTLENRSLTQPCSHLMAVVCRRPGQTRNSG
jgi:SAM-dependent methyltransferase